MILSANTFDGMRGSVNVMSFTNKYNQPGDLTERWVCIMKITGQNSSSEFAYELEDTQSDFNNDGQNDIVAASTFWRMDGADRNSTKTGAGWIFLTPPQQVFLDIQNSNTWATDPLRDNVKKPLELIAEEDYNLCVMQLNDTTGMPIDLQNDVPPNADALRVGSIGDLADAGDLDGDGITDFSVFGFYRYNDGSGSEVTTGAVYFMLSRGGFGSTGYTLHDKHSRVIGISGVDTIVSDPNSIGVAIDIYQDAEVVIHGDHERSYGNNQRSYFGLTLDGSGDSDMALVNYKYPEGGVSGNFGTVQVLLDGQADPRFSPNGSIGSGIPPVGPLRPLNFFYDDPILSPDYSFTGHEVLAPDGSQLSIGNITGVELAGNYDGVGDKDCEISITTIKGYSLGTGNPNFSLISTTSVIEIPPVSDPQIGGPTVLISIQHETPTYHSVNDPLTGSVYGSGGMHRRGLRAQAAWDQDGDGKDDLIIHTAATAAPVLMAPDPTVQISIPPVPISPVLLFDASIAADGFRPYQVEGQQSGAGSTHVLLSPADEPELIKASSRLMLLPNGDPQLSMVVTADKISPEIDSTSWTFEEETFSRQFDHNEFIIELIDPSGSIAGTVTCQSILLQAPGKRAPRRLIFDIPMVGNTTHNIDSYSLRIHTRWKNSDSSDPNFGEPWTIPVPQITGLLVGGQSGP